MHLLFFELFLASFFTLRLCSLTWTEIKPTFSWEFVQKLKALQNIYIFNLNVKVMSKTVHIPLKLVTNTHTIALIPRQLFMRFSYLTRADINRLEEGASSLENLNASWKTFNIFFTSQIDCRLMSMANIRKLMTSPPPPLYHWCGLYF